MLFLLFIGSTVSSRVSNPGTDYQSRDFGIGAAGIPAGIGITKSLYNRLGKAPSAANMTCLTVRMGGLLYTAFLTLILFGFSDGAVCASVKSHVPVGRRVPPIK